MLSARDSLLVPSYEAGNEVQSLVVPLCRFSAREQNIEEIK